MGEDPYFKILNETTKTVTEINRIRDSKYFQLQMVAIGIGIATLLAAIVLCPPLGIAASIGLTTGYAWLACTLPAFAAGLTLGSIGFFRPEPIKVSDLDDNAKLDMLVNSL